MHTSQSRQCTVFNGLTILHGLQNLSLHLIYSLGYSAREANPGIENPIFRKLSRNPTELQVRMTFQGSVRIFVTSDRRKYMRPMLMKKVMRNT
jgi:hypothetical protein